MTRGIVLSGTALTLAYSIHSVLSYWIAPATLFGSSWSVAAFYPSLIGIGADAPVLSYDSLPYLSYFPTLVATIICAVLLIRLFAGSEPSDNVPRALYTWAIVFAVVSLPSLPIVAQDLWVSATWGKMIAEGLNPYYNDIPDHIGAIWYPDTFRSRMTYGPLWAVTSGFLMYVSDNRWIVFSVFKLILFGFWLLALDLTRKITAARSARERCVAIVMVGWLPLNIGQSLAEGHNDIAMAALVLLWIYSRNTIALAAAIMMKYVAAPLAFIALLDRRKPMELAVAVLICICLVAFFYRGSGFFDGNLQMSHRHFLTPRDTIEWLGAWSAVASLPFAAIAAVAWWRYFRHRTDDNRIQAAIGMIGTVFFVLTPFVWPWYLVLILLPAAQLPAWRYSIWIAGLALAAPLMLPILEHTDWTNLLFYALATAWLAVILAASRWSKTTRIRE